MTLRIKLLIFFLFLYLVSLLILTLSTVYLTRKALVSYLHDYMEDYMAPVVEFYSRAYKNPHYYIKLMAEDLASQDRSVIAMDDRGRLVYAVALDEGSEIIRKIQGKKKGVLDGYAFVSRGVDGYKVYLLMKLDEVENIKRGVVKLAILSFLLLSLPSSAILVLFLRRMLRPIEYLTSISLRVYSGDTKVKVEPTSRRDELGFLQNVYSGMLEKLKGTIEWQKRFIADVTHSIKTPLTYIKGQLELISMGVYDENKTKEVIEKINIQINKVEKLINHLAVLMRIESGIPLKMSHINLSEILAELDEEYDFIRKSHRFIVRYPEEDIQVFADKEYLKIAISNLIENSYKYTPAGKSIEVYYRDKCLFVEDEGIGVKEPSKVFEMFYRESHEKEGSGLGLSIVKAIAEAHGFKVGLETRETVGTRAYICFESR